MIYDLRLKNKAENEFITNSSSETEKLAQELASIIQPRDVLLLTAELGGGKTTFTRGLVKGLGFESRVISPTFTLQKTYIKKINEEAINLVAAKSIKTVYHLDLYRLKDARELHSLDMQEMYTDHEGITVIEWPAISHDVLKNSQRKIKIQFEYIDANIRKVIISVNA